MLFEENFRHGNAQISRLIHGEHDNTPLGKIYHGKVVNKRSSVRGMGNHLASIRVLRCPVVMDEADFLLAFFYGMSRIARFIVSSIETFENYRSSCRLF